MTKLGMYLAKRAINKAEVCRRTGINKTRLNELSMKETAQLKSKELYLIALAIQIPPAELLEELHGDLTLKS